MHLVYLTPLALNSALGEVKYTRTPENNRFIDELWDLRRYPPAPNCIPKNTTRDGGFITRIRNGLSCCCLLPAALKCAIWLRNGLSTSFTCRRIRCRRVRNGAANALMHCRMIRSGFYKLLRNFIFGKSFWGKLHQTSNYHIIPELKLN